METLSVHSDHCRTKEYRIRGVTVVLKEMDVARAKPKPWPGWTHPRAGAAAAANCPPGNSGSPLSRWTTSTRSELRRRGMGKLYKQRDRLSTNYIGSIYTYTINSISTNIGRHGLAGNLLKQIEIASWGIKMNAITIRVEAGGGSFNCKTRCSNCSMPRPSGRTVFGPASETETSRRTLW